MPPNMGPGLQPRHVPDQELNSRPFASRADAQQTEPHKSGPVTYLFCFIYVLADSTKRLSITLLF